MTKDSANHINSKPPTPKKTQKSNNNKTGYKKRKEKRPPKKITESYLHNAGLYYLERFAASQNHFRSVMMRKIHKSCAHHTDQDKEKCIILLDKLIEKFVRSELLNDAVYTKSLINNLRRKGLSQRAIITKARIKGIAPEQAIEILEEHDLTYHETQHEADIKSAILLARKKRLGPFHSSTKTLDKEAQEKLKNRQLAAMARAGYSFEIAKYILEMNVEEAEEAYYAQNRQH